MELLNHSPFKQRNMTAYYPSSPMIIDEVVISLDVPKKRCFISDKSSRSGRLSKRKNQEFTCIREPKRLRLSPRLYDESTIKLLEDTTAQDLSESINNNNVQFDSYMPRLESPCTPLCVENQMPLLDANVSPSFGLEQTDDEDIDCGALGEPTIINYDITDDLSSEIRISPPVTQLYQLYDELDEFTKSLSLNSTSDVMPVVTGALQEYFESCVRDREVGAIRQRCAATPMTFESGTLISTPIRFYCDYCDNWSDTSPAAVYEHWKQKHIVSMTGGDFVMRAVPLYGEVRVPIEKADSTSVMRDTLVPRRQTILPSNTKATLLCPNCPYMSDNMNYMSYHCLNEHAQIIKNEKLKFKIQLFPAPISPSDDDDEVSNQTSNELYFNPIKSCKTMGHCDGCKNDVGIVHVNSLINHTHTQSVVDIDFNDDDEPMLRTDCHNVRILLHSEMIDA